MIYSEREDLFSKIIKCICVYGDLKQNYSFTRFRRRGMEEVISEIMLHLLGYAIRKLFRFFETDKKCNFWSAPSDLEPEKFKKPSTKRLAKKAANKDINSSKIKHT